MTEFLEKAEIEALERAIAKARGAPGIHRDTTMAKRLPIDISERSPGL
jgi:hypothetical protein